jgi:hypothetical protein
VLLSTYPALAAPLFAALCVMARCRPSALVEPAAFGGVAAVERELERVLGTLQRRFDGLLAFDYVDGDDAADRALLLWNPGAPAIAELLPPGEPPPAADAEAAPWRQHARPTASFVQSTYARGLLCAEPTGDPTQTVRYLLTLPAEDGGAPAELTVHEEDCDESLTRAAVLAQLGRYRSVAKQLGGDVHADLEFDTQEGDLDAGDMVERHIRNSVTLRGPP